MASSGSAFFGLLPTSPSLFRSMTMSGTRHGLLSPSITSPPSTRRRSTISGKEHLRGVLFFSVNAGDRLHKKLTGAFLWNDPDTRSFG